jgi:hypothetical protein
MLERVSQSPADDNSKADKRNQQSGVRPPHVPDQQPGTPKVIVLLFDDLLFTTLKMEGICVSQFRITAGTRSEGGFFSGVRAEPTPPITATPQRTLDRGFHLPV